MSGRRITEDPTSYVSTGIPRGDPRRYESRGVMRMGSDKNVKTKDQRLEMPQEDIETEGERQLKKLVHKQLNTDVTIDSELAKRKTFTASSSYAGVDSKLTGTLTYEQYVKLSEADRYREELKACGLTEEEIEIKAIAEGVGAKKRKVGIESSILKDKLREIDQKIQDKKDDLAKPEKFAGQKYMSRQEYDLEQAITQDREKAKLLSCLMTQDRPDVATKDPKDPINNLNEIWDEMRQHAREETRKKRKRRKKQKKGEVEQEETEVYEEGFIGPLPKDTEQLSPLSSESIFNPWVSVTKESPPVTKSIEQDEADEECSEETPVEIVPEDAIIKYKLTVEQIKELPRFKNYSPGSISAVLYLKNLSDKVKQNDLLALFGRYDSDDKKVECKLLKGRMRGQAFVTFPDCRTSEQALQLINGYHFKGKPIIIQYGHKGIPS